MSIVEKFINLIYGITNSKIECSSTTTISSMYGLFRLKVYKDSKQEYLAIMSNNFCHLQKPIVYIHSDIHGCDPLDSGGCYCNNQMAMALKMIYKEGGLIIYHSKNVRDIDGLLSEIKAKRLQKERNVFSVLDTKVDITIRNQEYYTLASIFRDLKLACVQLISNDLKTIIITDKLGIEIIKRVPMISFEYGSNSKK